VREEDRDLVRRHLSALSYVQAEVLMLRYFEGLSRQEIATVLDIPESTVKSRLYDGLKNLHDQMGEKPL
jgi:RNA polymerase sigma-70 factor (ECF subfamily)